MPDLADDFVEHLTRLELRTLSLLNALSYLTQVVAEHQDALAVYIRSEEQREAEARRKTG